MADPTLLDVTHQHTEATRALLAEAGYPLYIGEVTDDGPALQYPYLVVWPTPGTVEHDDIGYGAAHYWHRFTLTAVGRDVRETEAALDRARTQLVAVRPDIPGRACGLYSERDGDVAIAKDPEAVDPNTGRPVFFAATDFQLYTCPSN